ncbi:MAG: hypothetical protein IT365_03315 [Candidatus Hydrogenedentes bacterium]|nr:hypothetical protein [Candidatus Hydrogenedentota bacterium]
MNPASSTSSSKAETARAYLTRCCVLALIVGVGQVVVCWWRWPGEIPPVVLELHELRSQPADVLYLGDSTLMPSRTERCFDRTPAMLQRAMPDVSVVPMVDWGCNLTYFSAVAACLEESKIPVGTVVFPINMRMVAPQLDNSPYRYFDKETVFLENDYLLFQFAYRPLASFKTFPNHCTRHRDFWALPVMDGEKNLGPAGNYRQWNEARVPEEYRPRLVMFFYMYSLTPDSHAVVEFGRLLDILNRAGIRALPYVTPLDMETGEKYFGDRFRQRIRENIGFFKEAAETRGVQLLDLSECLSGSYFVRGSIPDEHMYAAGREVVAERLAEALRQGP